MPILPNISAFLAIAALGALAVHRHRRSARRQVPDLRDEVRCEQASLQATLDALAAQIARAAQRPAGTELVSSELELLRSGLSATAHEDASSSDMEWEIRLVEVLALSLRAEALAEKYRTLVSEHDISISDASNEDHMDRETLSDGAGPPIRESAA